MAFFLAFFSTFSAIITGIKTIVEEVSPTVMKIIRAVNAQPNEPGIHPNCQEPICGQSPHYCPEHQLTPSCRQQRMQIANTVSFIRTTMALNLRDNDDTTEKSSTSSNTTMMLVLVAVIGLAIVGFLYMRFKQANQTKSLNRRSSTWSV